MTGPLEQIVTLTGFGNDYLFNNRLDSSLSENSSFQFCNRVDFRVFERPFIFMAVKEKVIAQDPNEWFEYLKGKGCLKMRLYFQSSEDQSLAKDYKLAGLVGGGGVWIIEANFGRYSNAWSSRWTVTGEIGKDRDIWTVNYGQTKTRLPVIDLQISLEKCKEELYGVLSEIEKFAIERDLKSWAEQFSNARKTLLSAIPETYSFNKNLIPKANYSLTARQLVNAAGVGWVFGGMGSWNDLGFKTKEEEVEYENLSERLYDKINQAIIASVNSF